jgi:hypothetical protein
MKKPIRKIRTRTATATPTTKKTVSRTKTTKASVKKRPSKAGFTRGASGFDVATQKREAQEEDYERRKNTPFGFYLKPKNSAEVILLDDGDPFFVSLHKIKHNGYWEDVVCIADTGVNCPICEKEGKAGSYCMILSCLDRRPYKTKAGENIKVSKKLFIVKGRNLPKFERQFKGKAKGNFRGVKVMCTRDGDKEASIGEDLEFLGRIKESALAKFGENATPADYEDIYKIPTADELRLRYGVEKSKVAGSEEFDNDDDENLENVGWDN